MFHKDIKKNKEHNNTKQRRYVTIRADCSKQLLKQIFKKLITVGSYLMLKSMRKNSPSELLSTITDVDVLTAK